MEQLIIALPVLLFSVIVHEVAHGWSALRLGDPTAARMGRLTLNPVPHVDPVMSLLVPALCMLSGAPIFGGAKPVPVNPWYFRHPSRDMALVAAAGPISNLLLAFVAGLLMNTFFEGRPEGVLGQALTYLFMINLVLAAFNLLPIPPLDGSRIVAHLLKGELAERYRSLDRFGLLIIMAVIIFFRGPLYSYLSWFMGTVGRLFY
jgi:Zn-dependent protease